MTKEEKEHLEFIKKTEEVALGMFDKLAPYMANEHNPKYVTALKGHAFEKMNADDRERLGRVYLEAYNDRYTSFRNAWADVFGTGKVMPFGTSNKKILEQFMNDAMKAKEKAFTPNYATNWLKKRYASEVQLGGLKKETKII